MDDKAFDELRLCNSICPGAETYWEPPGYSHWIALHKAKDELRGTVSQARTAMAKVEADKDLVPEAKRRRKQAIATQTLTQLEQATSLQKARDSVELQMQKWAEKVAAVVKPAANDAEARVHSDIRRHVKELKDERERKSFLEKRGADPTVASALLEAPPFLANLSDSEVAFVKAKVEQKHLSPEIVEAKGKVEKAVAELERGHRAAQSLVATDARMVKGADGQWREPPVLQSVKVA